MFTGIIEELGEVEEVRRSGDRIKLGIRAEKGQVKKSAKRLDK